MVDTAQGLREVRSGWQELEHAGAQLNPFLTWEWQWSWWETFGAGHEPRYLLVRAGESLIGLVPLCISSQDPDRLLFGGGLQLSDQLGFMHLPGREREVADATLDWARASGGEAAVLDLHFLPQDSAPLLALRAAAEARSLTTQERPEEVSPGLALPADFDTYLAQSLGKKERHELRRKFRRLDEERPDWHMVSQDDRGPESALEAFLHLLQASGEHKREFLTPQVREFFSRISRHLQERGWLRIQLLETQGEVLGGIFGFTMGGVWHLYNSGYDPNHGSLSPGLLCVAEGIRSAIDEGCSRADMLRGNEPYKYRLGAHDWPLQRLLITSGSTRTAP
ncbi:MAG: GNAT family N-acetyltransferase [Candidatus Dormibacteria bacterium]